MLISSTMKSILQLVVLVLGLTQLHGQLMISGNEGKIDLTSGVPEFIAGAPIDSVTLINFSKTPPRIRHLLDLPNTVIGPPSNLAITPDGTLALIANSIEPDPANPGTWKPGRTIHLLDVSSDPPFPIGQIQGGLQPSGMSITPDGKLALIANRAGGTVSVIQIDGLTARVIDEIKVCEPEEEASDVAISPDGKFALVSIREAEYLRLLKISAPDKVEVMDRKFGVFGRPYRCVITPDGRLGLTAGAGRGGPLDSDALSVIDLSPEIMRTVDHIAIGAVPESIEVSPDGKWVAAVLMNGTNLNKADPLHSAHGLITLLERKGNTYVRVQEIKTGPIPEGVAFTSDGSKLVVQIHPEKKLYLYEIKDGRLVDTGERIDVPGMPSSLRAQP